MKCTVSKLQVNKVIDLDHEGANAPRSSKQMVPRLPRLPGSGVHASHIEIAVPGADSAGGGGGHRGTCPPAVTPSMGISVLFSNVSITF